MNKSKIMIALRKGNGQIGYLSEGLEIPEFFELICSKDNKKILVDYSLIIEKLHEIHQKNEDMSIINKFNIASKILIAKNKIKGKSLIRKK